MSEAGNDNANDNPNVIYTIKDTKLHVPVVTLSAKDNQKLSKLLSQGSERSVYWNKTKNENNTTKEYRCFLKLDFVGFNRLFVLFYSNEDAVPKRFKTRKYYCPKRIIKNYSVIINGKPFVINQLILI